MRILLAALLLACTTSAQAQYPYGYPGGRPYGQPYGQSPYGQSPYGQPTIAPYVPPAPARGNLPPSSLAQEMLEAHNAVRAQVGDPPLAWSPRLAAVAQDWANHSIATGIFAHRPDNRYGENLYAITGGAASPVQVVAAWAAEARGYDLRGNTCTGVCGHYTQLVWRATRSVGCGVATDPEREIWVCDYDPPGNVVGYRPY
ncbi:MAG TPA: CAP domain-containing protein [Acetobacteraceae bacterium]|nr:CAP domain-containing protein [Acetobacteraceae bacterium]